MLMNKTATKRDEILLICRVNEIALHVSVLEDHRVIKGDYLRLPLELYIKVLNIILYNFHLTARKAVLFVPVALCLQGCVMKLFSCVLHMKS
jgi:hypothetical protein